MEYKKFRYEEHIKKHMSKENTYCDKCAFCVLGDYEGERYYLIKCKEENKTWKK